MRESTFSRAVALALDKSVELPHPYGSGKFSNYALPGFGVVDCTLAEFAGLVRCDAVMFNGEIDPEAMAELRRLKNRFAVAAPRVEPGPALTLDEAKRLARGTRLYDREFRNGDGHPARWKVSGAPKTWRRDPGKVEVQAKHGLYVHERITERNLDRFALTVIETSA